MGEHLRASRRRGVVCCLHAEGVSPRKPKAKRASFTERKNASSIFNDLEAGEPLQNRHPSLRIFVQL